MNKNILDFHNTSTAGVSRATILVQPGLPGLFADTDYIREAIEIYLSN